MLLELDYDYDYDNDYDCFLLILKRLFSLFFKTPPTHLRVNHVLPTQLTPAGELNAALLFLSFPQEFLQRVHSPTKTEYRTCVVEFRDWISLKSDWSDLFR